MSAPASSASASPSSESTSISTGIVAASARTAANASATPPAASDVVVLDERGVGQPHPVVGAAPARARRTSPGRAGPGVVLRVSRTTPPVPARASAHRAGQRGDAGEVAQQVERRALGGEQQPGRRRHAGDVGRRRRPGRRRRRGSRTPTPPSPHTASITAAATGEPGDDAVARVRRTSRRCAVRPARWRPTVTSMPPIRSSATAARTSAATASGSSPPASRRCACRRRQRVEHRHHGALRRRQRCERTAGDGHRSGLGGTSRADVQVSQPLRRAARGSRCGGGSRGSRSRASAAASDGAGDGQHVRRLERPTATADRTRHEPRRRRRRASSTASARPAASRSTPTWRDIDVRTVTPVAGSTSAARRRRRRLVRCHRLGQLPRQVAPEPGAGDDALGEAVRRQTVGAVHTGAGHLADGVEAGERGRAVEAAPARHRRRSAPPARPGCARAPGRCRSPGTPR